MFRCELRYRDTGFIEKLEYGNGMIQESVPDVRNRIDLIQLYHRDTPLTKDLHLDYTLDGEGNVLAITNDTFKYDSQNRLKTAKIDGQSWTYNLDVMGNRTSVVENGVTKSYTTVDHNLLTAAGGNTYTYDSLGNTTSKTMGGNTYTYRYDEENRLRKVLLNGVVVESYWYDAGGMRVRKETGGKAMYYIYNGLDVIHEDDLATGERTDYVFAAMKRIAAKGAGGVKYFHLDHLGSTRVVTDAIGDKIGEYKYDAFGLTISHSGSDERYKFTGKPEDAGTGLQYFGARYYDPEVGRFTTVDPAQDGLNWYEYCRSNPLRYIDLDGEVPKDIVEGIVIGVCKTVFGIVGAYYGVHLGAGGGAIAGVALAPEGGPASAAVGATAGTIV